jgi:aromatic ring-opening dioxygenase catalytic subunit (LigB family)
VPLGICCLSEVLLCSVGPISRQVRTGGKLLDDAPQVFDGALTRALTDAAHTPEQRREALVRWAQLPEARFAHPREEHLLPLHVVRVQHYAYLCSLK